MLQLDFANHFHRGPMMPYAPVAAAVLGGVALALLIGWRLGIRRKRLLENLPTCNVKGVAIGLTELKGEAFRYSPLASYLAETPCAWYRYSVEEQWRKTESYTDSKGKRRTRTRSGWKTVASGEKRMPFHLEDCTGVIRIVPRDAKIEGERVLYEAVSQSHPLYYGKGPPGRIFHSTGRRRFVEHAIRQRQQVYVLGSARIREDKPELEVAHDDEAELFLISVRSEEQITRGYVWQVWLCGIFSILFAAAMPVVLAPAGGDVKLALAMQWPWMLLAAAGLAGVMLLVYSVLLFNGLVDVRQRMRKAFSLIDVQLERRSDLIPRLVEVVKGYQRHEAGLQQHVANLRSGAPLPQASASAPPSADTVARQAAATDAQSRALDQVMSVVEKHPELKAGELFLKLQAELADTEERIALARSFFNASVTTYNTRIQSLPDLIFARLFGFREASLYEIEEFERRPVRVDFGLGDEDGELPESQAEIADDLQPEETPAE